MIIEETVLIQADMGKVWETFTDLTCWQDWSRTLTPMPGGETRRLERGRRFRFCIRPFAFPVHLEPLVEEVVPLERIVWSGAKYGVSARHEFSFRETADGVLLRSRETFSGALIPVLTMLFSKRRVRDITTGMLRELKKAAEA